jgi:hypothetical protein
MTTISQTSNTQKVESKGTKKTSKCSAVFEMRDWSGEFRIRSHVKTSFSKPPLHFGRTITNKLSPRGRRKLMDSACYVASKKGGYTTSITATFGPEARKAILNGDPNIQKEISRTLGALQKKYSRGWITSAGEKVAALKCKLTYCWVIENPKNVNGEDNPHVHILLGWEVPSELFDEWSTLLEGIWGNGFFHINRIVNRYAAASYISKAANFKGSPASQGKVIGRRYGISKSARAPSFETIGELELGDIGKLITHLYLEDRHENRHLYSELERIEKSLKKAEIRNPIAVESLKNRRKDIYRIFQGQPFYASRYQTIFRNEGSFISFIQDAISSGACSRDMLSPNILNRLNPQCT